MLMMHLCFSFCSSFRRCYLASEASKQGEHRKLRLRRRLNYRLINDPCSFRGRPGVESGLSLEEVGSILNLPIKNKTFPQDHRNSLRNNFGSRNTSFSSSQISKGDEQGYGSCFRLNLKKQLRYCSQ